MKHLKCIIIFLFLSQNFSYAHDRFNLWDCFVDNKRNKCIDYFKNSKILYPSMGLIGKWKWSSTKQSDSFGIYEGYEKNGVPDGIGTMVWKFPRQVRYFGQWKFGRENGFGIKFYHDDSVYIGNFVDGEPNGLGNYIYSDERRFSGKWLNSEPHGKGIMKYPDGKISIGEFRESKDWNTKVFDQGGKQIDEYNNGEKK